MMDALTYRPKLELRDYQREAVDRMAGKKAFALLMAMRTGKTAVALADFGRLETSGECQDLLIAAPAGCYRTWLGEIDKHLAPELRSRLRVNVWTSGMGAAKREELEEFLHAANGPRAFLVNVEALSVKSTGAREACEMFLAPRRSMMIIDESVVVKSPKAKRTKYINANLAPMADYRRILSGLPTPRSPLDLYCQFEFLDKRILRQPLYRSFMHRYAIVKQTTFGGRLRRPAEIVVGYRNTDELADLIEPHSYRVEFRPNIPPSYTIREVELTPEQKRMYRELKEEATTMLEGSSYVSVDLVIVQMLRLHQVLCGHVKDENGVEHTIPENKTKELMSILEDYAGKAVIWCSYDADVRKVAEAIAREYDEVDPVTNVPLPTTVARFWGGNVSTREQEEARFKSDPRCRFMVSTPDAGGRGRTWDVADLVIYYSSRNNLDHRDQSEMRAHATGKVKQVDYIDLIAPGTVEEKILQALRSKMDLAAIITKDSWREWIV